jgi:hypothetical protein
MRPLLVERTFADGLQIQADTQGAKACLTSSLSSPRKASPGSTPSPVRGARTSGSRTVPTLRRSVPPPRPVDPPSGASVNVPAGLAGSYRWLDLLGEGCRASSPIPVTPGTTSKSEGGGSFGAQQFVIERPAYALGQVSLVDLDADGDRTSPCCTAEKRMRMLVKMPADAERRHGYQGGWRGPVVAVRAGRSVGSARTARPTCSP